MHSPGQTSSSRSPSPPNPNRGSTLEAGQTLQPGWYLTSPNGQYELVMQATDGNLVLYKQGEALWSTGPEGAGASVTMQSDGNLVTYNEGAAKWASHTAGFPGADLQLQNDGNLVVYQDGHPVWDRHSGYLGNLLREGWTLQPGAYLLSPKGQYRLVMQATDGNLVLYKQGEALWSTGPEGAGASVTMQSDGNLVIYNAGQAKWASQTAGFPGAFLQLQDDSNLVIYQGVTAIWDRINGHLGGSVAEVIVREARKWEGAPYCFAGGNEDGPTLGREDPENELQCGVGGYDPSDTPGFDCTGLTIYAVYQATKDILVHDKYQAREAIADYHPQVIHNESELRPGDIVYFGGELNAFIHAGVYVGGGSFVSAVTEGTGVKTETMAWEESAYGFVGALRF